MNNFFELYIDDDNSNFKEVEVMINFDIYMPTETYNEYMKGFDENVENLPRPFVGPFNGDFYIPFTTQNQNKAGCMVITVNIFNKRTKKNVKETQTLLLKNAIRIHESELVKYVKQPKNEKILKYCKNNKPIIQEELNNTIEECKNNPKNFEKCVNFEKINNAFELYLKMYRNITKPFQEKIDELKGEVDVLQSENKWLEGENAAKQNKIVEQEEELRKKINMIVEQKNTINSLQVRKIQNDDNNLRSFAIITSNPNDRKNDEQNREFQASQDKLAAKVSENEELKDKIKNLEETVSKQKDKVNSLTDQVANLSKESQAKDNKINGLSRDLQENEAMNSSLMENINSLSEQVNNLQKESQAKDNKINELSKEIKEKEAMVKNLTAKIGVLVKQIVQLKSQSSEPSLVSRFKDFINVFCDAAEEYSDAMYYGAEETIDTTREKVVTKNTSVQAAESHIMQK